MYRGATSVAQTTTPSYSDQPLASGATYSYYVVAYDNGGNASQPSATVWVTLSTSATTPTTSTTTTPTTITTTTTPTTTTTTPTTTTTATAPADVTVSVDRSHQVATSKLSLGVTMGQSSLQPWGDAPATASAQALLDGAVTYQNQFTYGWGVTNPEISPGTYSWGSLDNRVAVMHARTNAIPVLSLCGAPDWMTAQGTNTSNYRLDDPPTPAHYRDFAELARQTALRYSAPSNPRPVLYYQVWSELRGFWSVSLNNFDYAAYTTLYNEVYDALKSVNPAIQVGGPYMPFEGDGATQDLGVPATWSTQNPISPREVTFMQYWLANMHGADFIDFDRGDNTNDPNTYTDAQLFALIHWYGAVTERIRALPGYGGQPVWLAEATSFADPANPAVQDAAEAATISSSLLSGTSVLLKWQDDGTFSIDEPWNSALTITGLYTSTLAAGGGQPYPVYSAYKLFHDDFPSGTVLYSATSSSSHVVAVSSASITLLINETASTLTASVNGTVVSLAPYSVRSTPA